MNLKIATLNLCLGLMNKREEIKKLIEDNDIDIICLQETEITKFYNNQMLTLRDYNLEIEKNSVKGRVAIYIKNGINYVRRTELEGIDSHLVIVDIKVETQFRLINLYRSFNPQN